MPRIILSNFEGIYEIVGGRPGFGPVFRSVPSYINLLGPDLHVHQAHQVVLDPS